MGNVAVLWDIENVTPSKNSLFIEGLTEYSESIGRVIAARAYCDWAKPSFRNLAPLLAAQYFYLVHIPKQGKKKNSADIQLVSDALELLTKHEHIDSFILVTGDSDFRPLVLALRRAGKYIHIICDFQNAAQDLLAIADTFRDFHDLLPSEVEDEVQREEEESLADRLRPQQVDDENAAGEFWCARLAEAASIIITENKTPNPGSVKLRMRILNPNFNEKDLGFKRWNDFVYKSARLGYIKIEDKDRQTLIYPGPKYTDKQGPLFQSFEALKKILWNLDDGKSAGFHIAATVNQKLIDMGIDVKVLGFRRFKEFIQAAETRGLVESSVEKLNYMVKRLEDRKKKPYKFDRIG